jgi:hypothetical protein
MRLCFQAVRNSNQIAFPVERQPSDTHAEPRQGANRSSKMTGLVAPIQLERSALARGGLAGWVLTLHEAKVIFTSIHIARCPPCE